MPTGVRRAVRHAAKNAAVAYDVVRPSPPGVAVLAYHRVGGGSGLSVDLDPGLFADQMALIADRPGAVPLAAIGDLVAADAEPVTRVAVTFDDGTADFVDNALGALVENGVPATYYIATDFIERQRPFPDDGTPMTWSALAEAVSTGLVSVGSHTHTHTVMDKLSPDQADDELRRAAELIEDRLGVTAADFAYPKGVFGGDDVERVVGRHHRTAALVGGGVNRQGSTDLLRIDRVPVQVSDGLTYFEKKASGGMRLEGAIRTKLNRLRYRNKAN